MKLKEKLIKQILTLLLFSISFVAFSQVKPPPVSSKLDSLRKDSIKKADARSVIKSYETVIPSRAISHPGLFTVHQLHDTVYFEIPDSILHRDIEVISRLEKGPAGFGAYAGEELDEKTIRFERRAADSTIRIRYDLVINAADSGSAIFRAVQNSSLNPVVVSFPIKAYGKGHKSYVIDVTQFLKDGKSFTNGMDNSALQNVMESKAMHDQAVEYVHAYPINVELSITKNGLTKPFHGGPPPGSPVTIQTHTSFIELPEHPMQQRILDPRVGFFADQEWHFGDEQQKVEDRKFILRWRLEPKDEDLAKWKQGELVEPKKPIIIYIDPATPKQWRPYLIAGINDWQKAFEQAGFKSAIIGREWPENDTTMNMEDARYSFVSYFPSETENAVGPQIHDPRSGEIIQTHIMWYHNVMQLVHDWYMVQAAATDPKARHARFDDELMGELIRFVSSHEVGHTLGLMHNFGSSSTTPVDSLRSKHYLDIHGHTPSIMDYARFNYVAQPEDNIPENDLFPHIGEYDRWAIEWGYRNSNAVNPEDDKLRMRKLATDSLAKNPRLWYGEQISRGGPNSDPRAQSEDLGDDAAKANGYGIKNLQRILPNLPEWTKEDGGINENLDEMYKVLKDQYYRYMQHVLKNIGGVTATLRSEDDKAPVFAPVPKVKQIEALNFFDKELFTTPYWIINPNITDKVNEPAEPNYIEDLQVRVLNSLLDLKQKIGPLQANMRQFGEKQAFPIDEYIGIIHKSIWKELKSPQPKMNVYRRNLQKSYVGAMQDILLASTTDETDAYSLVRADMIELQKEIKTAIPKTIDKLDLYHLEDLSIRIKKTLESSFKQ